MYNPFEVLELKNDAVESEVDYAYKTLYARYSEERFSDGEKGNNAARMLGEIEKAYKEIKERFQKSRAVETYGYSLGEIDDMIKRGEYDRAQGELDKIVLRDGEWHYLQSIIFYKRSWFAESRKQLQLALTFEPENMKFKSALERLETVMANPAPDPGTYGNGQRRQAGHGERTGGQPDMCNAMSNCCCLACLADTCCSCMNCC